MSDPVGSRSHLASLAAHPVHHRCFVALAGLAIAALAGACLWSPHWVLGPYFLLGLPLWTLLEYVLHRGLFHLPRSHPLARLGAVQHLDHHDRPNDPPITKPLRLTVPAIVLGVSLLTIALGPVGLAAGAGIVAGYLRYELYHVAHHVLPLDQHPRPRVQRWHLGHHEHPTSAFGISTTVWDRLLGTTAPTEPVGHHASRSPSDAPEGSWPQ